MPRGPRNSAGGVVYHVINRANGRLRIFKKPADFIAFERIIAQGLDRIDMRLCGYCIMGNHWHFLLWPREDGDLSKFMQWITNTHSRRWHAAHGTTGTGHVYQGRFKSFPVQASEHYLKVLQYIESNPLRAKLVTSSCDWQYSSLWLRNFKSAEENTSKTSRQSSTGTGPVTVGLAHPVKLPDNWNKHVNIIPDETTEAALQNCVTRGCPYGGETWTKTISQKLNLESTLKPRGRPKKSSEKKEQGKLQK